MSLLEWFRQQELNKAKTDAEIKALMDNSYQFNQEVRLNIHDKEISIAERAVNLRHKIRQGDIDAQKQLFELEKEKDALERVKAEFKIYLEKQRINLYSDVNKAKHENSIENKKIDNEFYLNKQELFIKSQEIEYNFQLEKEKLHLQKEEILNKRIELEAIKAEKTAQTLLDNINQNRDQLHTEKLKQLELLYKEYELQMACIKMYTVDKQAQEFANLQQQLQDRIRGVFQGNNNGLTGEF